MLLPSGFKTSEDAKLIGIHEIVSSTEPISKGCDSMPGKSWSWQRKGSARSTIHRGVCEQRIRGLYIGLLTADPVLYRDLSAA